MLRAKTFPEIQRNLAAKSNALTAYLKTNQVQRLITSRVTFSPETKYDKSGPDKTIGYMGSATLSFRTTPDKTADLLAGVLANGANQIRSTTFTPTEQEIANARRDLSADATRIALAQADSIAKASGLKVVAIRNIAVDTSASFQPFAQTEYIDGYTGGRDKRVTPVDTASGDDEISIRVNIVTAAAR